MCCLQDLKGVWFVDSGMANIQKVMEASSSVKDMPYVYFPLHPWQQRYSRRPLAMQQTRDTHNSGLQPSTTWIGKVAPQHDDGDYLIEQAFLLILVQAFAMLQASPLRWNVPKLVLSCIYMACRCPKTFLSPAFLMPRQSRSGSTIWMRLGSLSFTTCPATSQMDAQCCPSRMQSSEAFKWTQNQFPSLQSGCIPTALNSWPQTCACT